MKFNEGRIFFQYGPITIAWYAVLILTGAMIALLLGIIEGKKIGIRREYLEDLCLFGIPIGVIGARLWFVLNSWDRYKDDLTEIFRIDHGGLAIHGALIISVIWGIIYCYIKKINFLKCIDLAAPGFLIAQAVGRWGNFMNQEAHGGPVPGATPIEQINYLKNIGIPNFIIEKMNIGGIYYHPTFLYESIWNILGFLFLILLRRTKKLYIGDLGLIYLMWYSLGRGYIEEMRTDSLYFFDTGIKTAQLLGGILFVTGALVFILRHWLKLYPKYYYEALEENRVQA